MQAAARTPEQWACLIDQERLLLARCLERAEERAEEGHVRTSWLTQAECVLQRLEQYRAENQAAADDWTWGRVWELKQRVERLTTPMSNAAEEVRCIRCRQPVTVATGDPANEQTKRICGRCCWEVLRESCRQDTPKHGFAVDAAQEPGPPW
jgi:hypothetical protein